jgi:hypothetical protein
MTEAQALASRLKADWKAGVKCYAKCPITGICSQKFANIRLSLALLPEPPCQPGLLK